MLAPVSVLVSLRTKATGAEKGNWVLLILAFLVIELAAGAALLKMTYKQIRGASFVLLSFIACQLSRRMRHRPLHRLLSATAFDMSEEDVPPHRSSASRTAPRNQRVLLVSGHR